LIGLHQGRNDRARARSLDDSPSLVQLGNTLGDLPSQHDPGPFWVLFQWLNEPLSGSYPPELHARIRRGLAELGHLADLAFHARAYFHQIASQPLWRTRGGGGVADRPPPGPERCRSQLAAEAG
jgi:hypothetical protein